MPVSLREHQEGGEEEAGKEEERRMAQGKGSGRAMFTDNAH